MVKRVGIKRVGISLVVLVALAMAGGFLFRPQLGSAMFERAADQDAGRDGLAGLPDGLHVGLCGTGSPMPNPERAGPCNVVVAGDQVFIVDIGEGGGRNLALMGIDAARIDAVFLTHFHSDHIDGLGPLALFHWTRGANTSPLTVYGPAGVQAVVQGFSAAYATDGAYRTAHHGDAVAPPSGAGFAARPFELTGDGSVVFERNGLKVTAFRVDHRPVEPAAGYRFDYNGRSLCISGDTRKSPDLERACRGVDLLVHEALQPRLVAKLEAAMTRRGNQGAAKIMHDIVDYHSSPEEAAASAQACGAKMLVLSHLVPPMPGRYLHGAFLGDAASHFDGPIIVGEDGMLFSLPADSGAIRRARLM